ncbi:hypothetical protein GCM10023115_41310 [Pontixanthobacter gangjinensis]|uniref:Uncharacterized protein n=2 Tax=Christiangramia aestuarii TaxID=1028746 RepID=A0A7K1LRQ1_9FLAO|nr:hypothetical protein [Christiangramia aestuarii]
MRRVLCLILMSLLCSVGFSQETYLIFEFMKVDNSQEAFYTETEDFWEKIHEQRVASGDIVGWDLWQLLPGGEDQGYQYLTVTIFNDPVKMMNAGAGIMESARMAYPDLSDEELTNRVNLAGGSRDLAVRLYLKVVDQANEDYEMKPGMIASFDLMKAKEGRYEDYEYAESETFKPYHQSIVESGEKGDWQLIRVLMPQGSEVYATHITVNMFDNWAQYLNSMEFDGGMTPDLQQKMNDGINTRDLKWIYMGTLLKAVRK